jgi:hypothetical protein
VEEIPPASEYLVNVLALYSLALPEMQPTHAAAQAGRGIRGQLGIAHV